MEISISLKNLSFEQFQECIKKIGKEELLKLKSREEIMKKLLPKEIEELFKVSKEPEIQYVKVDGCSIKESTRNIEIEFEELTFSPTEEQLKENPGLFEPNEIFFKVKTEKHVDKVNKKVVSKTSNIFLYSPEIIINLKNFGLDEEAFFDKTPKLDAGTIISYLPQIKENIIFRSGNVSDKNLRIVMSLRSLVKFLEQEYEGLTKRIESALENGEIGFSQLWYIFQKGKEFVGTEEGAQVAGKITSTQYVNSFFGSRFMISGSVIITDGKTFLMNEISLSISEYKDLKKIKSLEVQPLDEETKKILMERGKLFQKIGLGNHYLNYKGNLFRKHWFYTNYFNANGRVMIDEISFQRMNPNYPKVHQPKRGNINSIEEIPNELLFMCWPFIKGFSFGTKKWGEFLISNLSEVEFNVNAFDSLVLSPERKIMIKALVQYSEKTFTDIITNKGGGCIFLLHGNAGVGKTLTAETISELLKRPLYSITVGELGTNSRDLENTLREILEVCSLWKAVILLDEADIFLEQRSEQDIQRNGMVGIFLRLLEYHQGILFLTTNRVKNFDEAFQSRISISLKYDDLNYESRLQVWDNLLNHGKIKNINTKELAKFELNGREIKNMIRLATSLALSDNKPVEDSHFIETIKISKQFSKN